MALPAHHPRRPLNATAASLLGFLHAGPMTGWDLVATAQRRIGRFWSLTRSQVYRELSAMSDAGLIEAGETGPRDRRPYMLTEAGRAAFVEWASGEPALETIRHPLLLLVELGQHVPADRLAAALKSHRDAHASRLAEYVRQAAEHGELDPYAQATLNFGLAYERAVLAWIDELPAELSTSDADQADRPA